MALLRGVGKEQYQNSTHTIFLQPLTSPSPTTTFFPSTMSDSKPSLPPVAQSSSTGRRRTAVVAVAAVGGEEKRGGEVKRKLHKLIREFDAWRIWFGAPQLREEASRRTWCRFLVQVVAWAIVSFTPSLFLIPRALFKDDGSLQSAWNVAPVAVVAFSFILSPLYNVVSRGDVKGMESCAEVLGELGDVDASLQFLDKMFESDWWRVMAVAPIMSALFATPMIVFAGLPVFRVIWGQNVGAEAGVFVGICVLVAACGFCAQGMMSCLVMSSDLLLESLRRAQKAIEAEMEAGGVEARRLRQVVGLLKKACSVWSHEFGNGFALRTGIVVVFVAACAVSFFSSAPLYNPLFPIIAVLGIVNTLLDIKGIVSLNIASRTLHATLSSFPFLSTPLPAQQQTVLRDMSASLSVQPLGVTAAGLRVDERTASTVLALLLSLLTLLLQNLWSKV